MKKLLFLVSLLPSLSFGAVSCDVSYNGLTAYHAYIVLERAWVSCKPAGCTSNADVLAYVSKAAFIADTSGTGALREFNLPQNIPHTSGADPLIEVENALLQAYPNDTVGGVKESSSIVP